MSGQWSSERSESEPLMTAPRGSLLAEGCAHGIVCEGQGQSESIRVCVRCKGGGSSCQSAGSGAGAKGGGNNRQSRRFCVRG